MRLELQVIQEAAPCHLASSDRTDWRDLDPSSPVLLSTPAVPPGTSSLLYSDAGIALLSPDLPLTTAQPQASFERITRSKTPAALRSRLDELGIPLPVDDEVQSAAQGGTLGAPLRVGDVSIGNRIAIHPMEGCNANRSVRGQIDGSPSEKTLRAWELYGIGGGKLVLGGEAAAVLPEGRANPRQTLITPRNALGIKELNDVCREAHRWAYGDDALDDFVTILQLTHSGRNSRPDGKTPKPLVMFHHPVYDPQDTAHKLTDNDLDRIINAYVRAAKIAEAAGFNGVDVKACHGYLLHESLGAFTRQGIYGGDSLENRSRLLLTIIDRIKDECPKLQIWVRLSAFDTLPRNLVDIESGQANNDAKKYFPYHYSFGVNHNDPMQIDLNEPKALCRMLYEHGVLGVNVSAGNPYKSSWIQRPTPVDMFSNKEPYDPLFSVYRLVEATRQLRKAVPELLYAAAGLSGLEEFFPHVSQPLIRQGWTDFVGMGRRVLSDPLLPSRVLQYGGAYEFDPRVKRFVCRSFLECVVAMRSDHPDGAGCSPLIDAFKAGRPGIKSWIAANRPRS